MIDEKYRVKRVVRDNSKTAFVYKVKHGGKVYYRTVKDRIFSKGASREVMTKIVSHSRTKQGIKASLNYMSHGGDVTVLDENGFTYEGKDGLAAARDRMTDHNDPTRNLNAKGKENPQLAKHCVFSAPPRAKASPEYTLEAVRKTLNQKYPESRFVLAYHDDKKDHPHVHCLMRIRGDTDKPIDIRKADLRELRSAFCKELQTMGYDVQATHKQKIGLYKALDDEHKNAPKRQNGVYEVVKFGHDHYQFKAENSFQNYITVKTLNKGTEVTFWGKELKELCEREKVVHGDLIRLKKSGAEMVKVPEVDKNKAIIGWKETERNQWTMQNLGVGGIDRTQPLKTNVDLTTPDKLFQKQRQQVDFQQKTVDMVKKERSISRGIFIG